jgi:hypothetical protein
MTHTIPVSINQLQRLEHRIGTLEQAVRDLAHALGGVEKADGFTSLYHSKAFTAHKKKQLARFKNHPSQFVDPFETYQTP